MHFRTGRSTDGWKEEASHPIFVGSVYLKPPAHLLTKAFVRSTKHNILNQRVDTIHKHKPKQPNRLRIKDPSLLCLRLDLNSGAHYKQIGRT
eukprot:scaffold11993_cov148-Skeletonema_menzelii.AAC.2